MQATGIVAEYNPFHNGHLHHIRETKKITKQPVIAVMSASFMQRGEPAVLSKWQRAALAVCGGVDLVLELPAVFSLRSAQYFAAGAVQLLKATGCVSTLSCGVENPQRNFLRLARFASSETAQKQLKEKLRSGQSYAKAWETILGEADALNTPNDILALEYSKALLQTNIKPLYIQREDAGYNSTSLAPLASATAIRQALIAGNTLWQDAVPPCTRAALAQGKAGYDEKLLWQLICYALRTLNAEEIQSYTECSEGLHNVLKSAASATSLEEALTLCSRKRYSKSRIRRHFMQLLLLTKSFSCAANTTPAYLRILAFNNTGRQLLKHMKKTASLPLITKIAKNISTAYTAEVSKQFELEERATNIWSMLQLNPKLNRPGNDYLTSPIYVQNKQL